LSDGNVFDHSNLGEHSHASMPSSEEFATPGRIGNEAKLGYRQIPAAEEPKIYEGPDAVREAARDLTKERNATPPDPVERKQHRPEDAPEGARYATTAREAAKQLSEDHRWEDTVEAYSNLSNLGREIDNAKILAQAVVRGEITADQAREIENQANAQADAPQAEVDADIPPTSGIDPDIAKALENPKLRGLIEEQVKQSEQARATYLHATQELADVTTASVLASWPELRGLTAQTLPVALAAIARENPEKASMIRAHIEQASAILHANQTARAHQHQQQQQQLAQWSARENEAFAKMIQGEATPERQAAVKAEFENFTKETGLTRQQLSTVFAQNPALNSAAFQKIVWDALSHRAAKRTATANPASRNHIPQVMKPGVAKSKADIAEADLGELRSQFKKATGNEQLRLAVKLHQAQRRARG
jgi:hypothetical protein